MTDNITRLKEALEAVHQSKGRFCQYDSEGSRSRAEDAIELALEELSEAANPAAIRELLAERQSLLERLEQAEKDAKRYWRLRQENIDSYNFVGSLEALDAQIDAAIAAQEGGK